MLATLKARLKLLAGEIGAFTAKDMLDAAELKALQDKIAEVEALEVQIKTLEAAEAALARSAQPANQPVNGNGAPATPARKMSSSEKVGLLVFGMAKAYKDTGARGPAATFKAMDDSGFGDIAKEFSDQQRALNTTQASAGGVLVPDDMSAEIMDILRPRSTFLRGNPRRVPLVHGSYRLPAAATGSTAFWRGEGKRIRVSQPTFRDINLTAKFLDAMVPLTNQLIRWSLPDVKAWVERDMAGAIGTELDRAAYFGNGTVNTPLGITKIPGVTRIASLGGNTPTVANIEDTAAALELSMMQVNLTMDSAAWVMSPRSFIFLQNRRDGNGNRYYPELQMEVPRWRNKPVFFTTQSAVNGGAGTDEAEIALVNFDDVFFGESKALTFAVSTEATYINQNGDTISAFQNDLTLIKASTEVDVGLRYLEGVAVATANRWGA